MKANMKKLLSVCLILVMMLAMIPVSASAASVVASGSIPNHFETGIIDWVLDSDGVLTLTGTGDLRTEVVTPLQEKGLMDKVRIVKVEGFTQIQSMYWFKNCENLETFIIGESVTTLDWNAFEFLPIRYLTIPRNVTTVGKDMCHMCPNLETVVYDPSCSTVVWEAFYDCPNLKTVTIGDCITTIDNDAFGGCTSLETVNWSKNLRTINRDAFVRCGLTTLEIPGTVTSLGENAFRNCMNLTTVTIPASVTSVGPACFYGSDNLHDVYFEGDAPVLEENFGREEVFKRMRDEWPFEAENLHYVLLHFYEGNAGFTTPTWHGYPSVMDKAQVHEHNYVLTGHKDPTCTEAGYNEYTCECGDSYRETLPASCPSAIFVDAPKVGKWSHDAVDYVVKNGLMGGTDKTHFEPASNVDRAMLVTTLWRAAGSPEVEYKNTFPDVKAGKYYTTAVAWAVELQIVRGDGNGRFNPGDDVTRQDLCNVLYYYAKAMGIDTSARYNLGNFSDGKEISGYAKEAMSWLVAMDIIRGADGKVSPLDPATREQFALMLMNFIEKTK